jgi:ASC-1-like (ASCH) protein
LPVFRTKKEAFEWLRTGKKTIDVRKGEPRNGEIAVYLSGRKILRMKITKRETGKIQEVVRLDNYRLVIPSAATVDEALAYVHKLYEGYDGVFAAYHVAPLFVEGFTQ